jgi:hypothetical protein
MCLDSRSRRPTSSQTHHTTFSNLIMNWRSTTWVLHIFLPVIQMVAQDEIMTSNVSPVVASIWSTIETAAGSPHKWSYPHPILVMHEWMKSLDPDTQSFAPTYTDSDRVHSTILHFHITIMKELLSKTLKD